MSALYAKCIESLFQRVAEHKEIHKNRTNPTLEPMRAICSRMNNPQNKYKCIHIGGTNGKGSVSTKIAAALTLCGYRVGLLTSPHISSVRERIVINGVIISKNNFVHDYNKILFYEKDINHKLTFFEILTCMAFYHFYRINIDFAVIEVGLGGKWDGTNVIKSCLLSIIVSISLDHTKLLGNTVNQIAKDKAGIVKKGRPCVIGSSVPYNVVKERCNKTSSDLYQLIDDKYDTFDEYNTNLCKYALKILTKKYYILPQKINKLFKSLYAKPYCRIELININLYKLFIRLSPSYKWMQTEFNQNLHNYNNFNDKIKCILDVAHNEDGFKHLFKSLIKIYSPLQYSYRVIIGMNPKKDVEKCINYVTEYADYIHIVQSSSSYLGIDINKIYKLLNEHFKYDLNNIYKKGNGNVIKEIWHALNETWLHNKSKKELNLLPLSSSSDNNNNSNNNNNQMINVYKTEIIIVCGSFYIMNEARKALGLRYDDDNDDLHKYKHLRENST